MGCWNYVVWLHDPLSITYATASFWSTFPGERRRSSWQGKYWVFHVDHAILLCSFYFKTVLYSKILCYVTYRIRMGYHKNYLIVHIKDSDDDARYHRFSFVLLIIKLWWYFLWKRTPIVQFLKSPWIIYGIDSFCEIFHKAFWHPGYVNKIISSTDNFPVCAIHK